MREHLVLLVEDNPSDVALAQRAFSKGKIPVRLTVAEDGQDALEYLLGSGRNQDGGEMPELILLDLKLPRVDGLEVLRRIRADRRTSRLPVVVLTSSNEERDVLQSYELGANSFIRKPVDFTQFAEFVQHLSLYWLVMNEAALPKGPQSR